ncbi:helicase HerA-like domain-containing protein [Collinsella sp. An307]|uniref:helicase HerA-like domain-containing protein n=1 Tax=Collinsella sp. An307 TaxID=1965630 RepID=UPI000B37FDF6|nr:helicase HerA-like domain-containing protein [Collinsella sp. An307]OUO20514.1 ATP-binding protein [Collinsella sp. An307]
MYQENAIWMGVGAEPDNKHVNLLLNQANRHGLIAGASGTGKTVTLKVMAEGFSKAGVPVFMADVKGDITGMAQAGKDSEDMQERIKRFGIEGFTYAGCPVRIWDMLGGAGLPVRITISDMGPSLLSRLLELTEVQEGVLDIVFRIADDKNLLLIDLKDLRAMLNFVAEHADEYETTYGKVSAQSVGAILRTLISVEDQGGDVFFGEPALDLNDWFQCAENGQGYVNILNAAKLIQSPQIYAMFLLWMLSELFDTLPEEGDLDKPKFVFFFDEAHLLFNDMPTEFLDKIVQVVKLIRSKGVGVYFITQSPSDIPDEVLAQLSNRIQHGLRAYTPAEQKAVRAAAQSFRENPAFKSEDVILELGTGEALVSFLNEDGQPEIVERAKILPPQCLMAAASDDVMKEALSAQDELMKKYGEAVDRESAEEQIEELEEEEEKAAKEEEERKKREEEKAMKEKAKAKAAEKAAIRAEERKIRQREKQQEQMMKGIGKIASRVLGSFGREATRQITRNLFGGRRR